MIASFFLKHNVFKDVSIFHYIDLYGFTSYTICNKKYKLGIDNNEIYQYDINSDTIFIKLSFILNNISSFKPSFISNISDYLYLYDIILKLNEKQYIEESFDIEINIKDNKIKLVDHKTSNKVEYIINNNKITSTLYDKETAQLALINKLHIFNIQMNHKLNLHSLENLKKLFELYKLYCY